MLKQLMQVHVVVQRMTQQRSCAMFVTNVFVKLSCSIVRDAVPCSEIFS